MAWSDDAHVGDRRRAFTEKRRILRRAFEERDLLVWGSAAGLYLWVEVGDDLDATAKLAASGIVVTPGRVFGQRGGGYIRMALVPTVDECEAAAAMISAALD